MKIDRQFCMGESGGRFGNNTAFFGFLF